MASTKRKIMPDKKKTLSYDQILALYKKLGIDEFFDGDMSLAIYTLDNSARNKLHSVLDYIKKGLHYLLSANNVHHLEKSILLFNKALKLNQMLSKSDVSLVYFCRGCAYLHLGKKEQALLDLNEAERLGYPRRPIYEKRGTAYMQLGLFDYAIKQFEQAITLNPLNADNYFQMGMIEVLQGRIPVAIQNYERSILLKPNFAEAYYLLGNAFAKIGDERAAYSYLKKALAKQPDSPDANYSLGSFYLNQGNLSGALHYLKKAIDLNPNLDYAWLELARTYTQKHQSDLAEQCYQYVWHEPSSLTTKLFSGLQLCNMFDANLDLSDLIATAQKRNKKTALEYALILIAMDYLDDTQNVRNYLHDLFLYFTPICIPAFLKEPFFIACTRATNWTNSSLAFHFKDSHLVKEQLLSLIKQLSDPALRQFSLWQSIIKDTLLGSIFHTKRGVLTPAINRGCLAENVKALQIEIVQSGKLFMDEETKHALASDHKLRVDLKKHYPLLYKLLVKQRVLSVENNYHHHLFKPSPVSTTAHMDDKLKQHHVTFNINH